MLSGFVLMHGPLGLWGVLPVPVSETLKTCVSPFNYVEQQAMHGKRSGLWPRIVDYHLTTRAHHLHIQPSFLSLMGVQSSTFMSVPRTGLKAHDLG